jgi:transcriptional regulator with XRE-family HTH domain|tara:strand:- start:279 stop:515 length:237 start_codon:yes stop_codon:yes gene_type:complete
MARTGRKPLPPGDSKGCHELFNWIQERDLTYTKAGELLGYPKSRISRYVTGARQPNADAMYKMFKLTNIPMSDWLEAS